LNGDGFGIAWYSPLSKKPAVFKEIIPAWNSHNLVELARVSTGTCILAHVRQTSGASIEQSNCHPFVYKKFSFMHNGLVACFSQVKRDILNILSQKSFDMIKGGTDSEHVFALWLDLYRKEKEVAKKKSS